MNFAYLQEQLYPLARLPCQWHIAGGWAIDLFLGRVTRPHHDIDICLARHDQLLLQDYFPNCSFTCVENSHERPWAKNEFLEKPIHEIWMRGDNYALEFLLDDIVDGQWFSRRDHAVRLPLDQAVLQSAATGISFAAPQVALYFKAKKARDKDTADFLSCLPLLSPAQKAWLLDTIRRDHPWQALAERAQHDAKA